MKHFILKKSLLLTSALLLLGACGGGGSDDKDDDKENPPKTTLGTKQINDCDLAKGEILKLTNRNDKVDYLFTCQFSVQGSLIIDPDVQIEFASATGFKVDDGSIQAKGTAAKPIILTGKEKVKGAWKGVFVDSPDVKNELSHVVIDYAGGGHFNSNGDTGGIIIYAGAFLKVKNSTIRNSKTYGINSSYGGSDITLENNTITACDTPIIVDGVYPTTISGGKYTGNTVDAIVVNSDQIAGNHTWKDLGVPYRISNRLVVIAEAGKLIIKPGVTIEFESDGQLRIDEGASGSPPTLIAVGTIEKPILFTGVNKVLGAWKGIYFDSPSPINEIAFATIEYASNAKQKGAIEVWAGTVLNVHHVEFKHIKRCSINGDLNGVTGSNLIPTDVMDEVCEN
jgi:hypothetical protein